MATTIRIEIPRPFPAQAEILNDSHRFRVALCGRRFGKTELGTAALLRGALRASGIYWWVGLSWRSASMKRAWRRLKAHTAKIPGVEIREGTHEIIFPADANGVKSEIWLRSSEAPDALAGEGIRGVVLDEFTLMEERVWAEHIRPSLSDFKGWALFLGVPKGKGWSWRLWTKGQDGGSAEWKSWQRPTSDNPLIDPAEIESAKDGLPSHFFEQEYEAAVIDDAGGVFRGVMTAATATFQPERIEGHSYTFGVDWGQENDFTVIAVVDETMGELVHLDRYNQIGWDLQRGRLKTLAEKFKPDAIVAESNSIGSPNIEALVKDGLNVKPFLTTNASKETAINALTLAIERCELKILPEPVLLNELQAYERERLPSGLSRYGAPDGMHDDTVIATAIAWYSTVEMSDASTWLGIARQAKERRDAAKAAA